MSSGYLLDTNALLWWMHQPAALSRSARAAIEGGDEPVFVSAVSAMEIATKSRRGRLEFESLLAGDFVNQIAQDGFIELPIAVHHAQLAGSFASPHADPWDRLLAAQAMSEKLELVTNDRQMLTFGLTPYW